MARTNVQATRIKPQVSEMLTLQVLRSERISDHFARVTLGGGDIDRFTVMGFDQWFRLFIPVADDSLARLPDKVDAISYLKLLTMSKSSRPIMRNYTVRGHRADGPDGSEIDVDFVLHGSAQDGTAGPAARWAQTCSPGDQVAIFDEGVTFNQPPSLRRVVVIADETGLPAVAGIMASLPRSARGQAVIEVPAAGDRQSLEAPDGVEVNWIERDAQSVPGYETLAAAQDLPLPAEPFYGWVVGEQALPSGLRRHWVRAGVPKENITFCGYWKHKGH